MTTQAARLILLFSVAALAVLALAPADSPAQTPALTDQDIVNQLKAKRPRTRGVPAPAPNAADSRLIDALVKPRTRSTIRIEERIAVADLARRRPSIDIEIPFDYNSAAIGPKAVPSLVMLGNALSHPDLAGAIFLLSGHTDAKGGAGYNLALSMKRAEAVREFIIAGFKLAPERLVSMGFGFEQLKRSDAPLAAENRRVQVVNLSGG